MLSIEYEEFIRTKANSKSTSISSKPGSKSSSPSQTFSKQESVNVSDDEFEYLRDNIPPIKHVPPKNMKSSTCVSVSTSKGLPKLKNFFSSS